MECKRLCVREKVQELTCSTGFMMSERDTAEKAGKKHGTLLVADKGADEAVPVCSKGAPFANVLEDMV